MISPIKSKMMYNRYVLMGEIKSKLIKEIGACENCGYSEFMEILELAHITHGHESEKHIRTNVFLLCPTCHRAFDRGLIEIKGEVSDCHLIKYRSPLVLAKASAKASRLKKKSTFKWISSGDGKFYPSTK